MQHIYIYIYIYICAIKLTHIYEKGAPIIMQCHVFSEQQRVSSDDDLSGEKRRPA